MGRLSFPLELSWLTGRVNSCCLWLFELFVPRDFRVHNVGLLFCFLPFCFSHFFFAWNSSWGFSFFLSKSSPKKQFSHIRGVLGLWLLLFVYFPCAFACLFRWYLVVGKVEEHELDYGLWQEEKKRERKWLKKEIKWTLSLSASFSVDFVCLLYVTIIMLKV